VAEQKAMFFLGTSAPSRKAPVIFAMSFTPHALARLPLDGFSWNLMSRTFMKICPENPEHPILAKIWQKYRTLHVKT